MSTNLDEVRRRLELRLHGADKVLKGFKAEIANDIRPEVRRHFEESSQRLEEQLKQSTSALEAALSKRFAELENSLMAKMATERRTIERNLKRKAVLLIILSTVALVFAFISLLLTLGTNR